MRMAEYISREEATLALLEKGQHSKRYKIGETWELNFDEIREAINEIPAADVVEVIRCKDCRFFTPDTYGDNWCSAKSPGVSKGMCSPSGDSYCSDAERKQT